MFAVQSCKKYSKIQKFKTAVITCSTQLEHITFQNVSFKLLKEFSENPS